MRDDYHKLTERSTKALEHIAAELKGNLPAIEADLNLIARSLNDLVNLLRPKLTVRYSIGGIMQGNPVSMVVGQTATPTSVESNATNPNIPIVGQLQSASDNPGVVSVDPTSGIATAVSAGSANVTTLDPSNGLSSTTAFTVSTPVAVATDLTTQYTVNAGHRR